MVSSSPQVRYPDFYGIDMARLEELCAFRAAIALLEERGMWQVLTDTYEACKNEELRIKKEELRMKDEELNHVRSIYAPFTVGEINEKMVEMMRPEGMEAPIELVFQSIEGLHTAIPKHHGDWYFTGDYPTPGGIRRVNEAFVSWYESRNNVIS